MSPRLVSRKSSSLTLLAGGLTVTSASAVVTVFDNGGAGWSSSGTFPSNGGSGSLFSLDSLGVLPPNLADAQFRFNSNTGSDTSADPSASDDDLSTLKFSGNGGAADFTRVTTGVAESSVYSGQDASAKLDFLDNDGEDSILPSSFTGYFGLSLYDIVLDDGTRQYGWAELSASITSLPSAPDSYELNIQRIAIESEPNQAVVVGAVPEPGSTALLLLGATGLAAQRRRRSAA